jgi:propionate CoA-transferase
MTTVNRRRGAKFVNTVEQITYPVRGGVIDRGHRPTIITERAVFEVAAQGLMLTEIAKGVDVKKDILEQMEFEVRRRSAQDHG